MPPKSRPVMERLMAKVTKQPDGCWIFNGAKLNGYGIVRTGPGPNQTARAHRVVYQALVGPIPLGFHLDHLCHTPACVNPEHLEPLSPSEHSLRGWQQGKHANNRALAKAKTHCLRGHVYDEANTCVDRLNRRSCRACKREADKRYYYRQKVA